VTWPSRDGLLLLVYLGLGCSALAFALWAFGLRHLTAAQNAVFGSLELPVGLAAAALLLGEVLGPAQLAGAALLLTGALLAVDRSVAAAV
jgi:drug/metabolite transporter (DMT)-like permease